MHTKQQKYAQKAYEHSVGITEKYKEKDDPYRQKYGSMSHKLPLLIRKSGLAQALAFVQAKQEDAYNDLLDHLAEAIAWPEATDGAALAQKSRNENLDRYILLTRRVSDALIWYKRFAESVLDVKPTDDVPEGDDS
ncbi:MAG: type III-B CRISPR module-associated protein Cmr5 [Anaerolineales bacterium]|nr:type III-B CRISPR module-associated protein Cmr5 [Anaerolineales bacterium]